MNDLLKRLSERKHTVIIGGSQPTVAELQRRLTKVGYVFVKFTETQGGTELGIRVDQAATDLSHANFETQTGSLHLEGTLTLDYVPVRCKADIDLETLNGTGQLVLLQSTQA